MQKIYNNCYFTNHYSIEDPAEHIQNFVKAYEEKYGATPDAFAALGYDAGYLIAEAIKQAGSADRKRSRKPWKISKTLKEFQVKWPSMRNTIQSKIFRSFRLVDGKQTLINKLQPEH